METKAMYRPTSGRIFLSLFLLISVIFAVQFCAGQARAEKIIVGLITKTATNPFFVKMAEGAKELAEEMGDVEIRTYAGKYDGDNNTQIEAVESLIAAGAKGILITPSDTSAIVPVLERARAAGIKVFALDTPLDPIDAADATFATDNFEAGLLVGKWARAVMGDQGSASAKIGLLNLSEAQITVDVLRNQGFLEGFGINLEDPARMGDETDPRIAGSEITGGSEKGGRTGMENLLVRDSGVNLVYTINEPAAAGAYEALRSFGLDGKVTIVSVDGGCEGVRNVKAGIIGATSMQFPLLMATQALEAVVNFVKTGDEDYLDNVDHFVNTGVQLVTDTPVEIDGVKSISSEEAMDMCWG